MDFRRGDDGGRRRSAWLKVMSDIRQAVSKPIEDGEKIEIFLLRQIQQTINYGSICRRLQAKKSAYA
jgi:hypothetical protein